MQTINGTRVSWNNIAKLDENSLNTLKQNWNFHPLDLEDLGSEQQIPKLDIYPDYLFLIIQFPEQAKQDFPAHELAIFLGRDYLITIDRGESHLVQKIFEKINELPEMKKEWLSESSGRLLYELLDTIFRSNHSLVSQTGKEIAALEKEIFTKDPNTGTVRRLAELRRHTLNFKRIVEPHRQMITALSHTRGDFFGHGLSPYFDDIGDYLAKISVVLESYRETIDGLHTTVESLLTRRTNKLISLLTLISACLLPLSFVASFYGMNIPLPFQSEPAVIWILFFFTTVIVIAFVEKLKKQNYI